LSEYRNISFYLGTIHRKGDFKAHNIDLQWTDIPEGTGKCVKCDGETDIAVLTEVLYVDIVAGNNSKIVQVYVQLFNLGIHAAGFNTKNTFLENTKAISFRFWFQLMAYVNAGNLEHRQS
jgi:hypothetical protein